MEKVRLRDLGDIITGNTPSKKEAGYWNSNDIPFVKPDIISDAGITILCEADEHLSEQARSKARIVNKDAVLVTCIGSIGKVGIASDGEYAFNQQINAIVPNNGIYPKYLAYAILQAKPRLEAIANAPVVPIINKSQFGEFPIYIENDLTQQKKIVEKLDKLNGIINSRKAELNKLDELIKARFVELFGDPIMNPKGWVVKSIGELVTDVRYGTSNPAVEGGRYPYLRMNNLTYDGHIDLSDLKFIDVSDNELEKCVVRKGDVLFNRTNSVDLVGKTAVFEFEEDMVIAGYIIRVRLNNELLPEVLSQYMNLEAIKDILRNMAKGAVNQANINAQELQSIMVYVPDPDMQKQFVEIKKQVDKSKSVVQKSLEETRMLFDSLMQSYFG